MKKPVLCLLGLVFLFASFHPAKAGKPPVAKWTIKKPFEQKVFIENKGQYNLPDKVQAKDILFGAQLDGLEYYFTKDGIWIEHYVAVKRTAEELEQLQLLTAEKNLKAFQYKYVQQLHRINFINANPAAEITGNNEAKQYFNSRLKSNINIKASVYKKITYKNLYPGIDMEFYFPEGKPGFEYSFIVHLGADVSQIKMQYPLSDGIALTPGNNIIIPSAFGEFTDHAPVANQQGSSTPIACSFKLNKNEVDFTVGDYDKSQDLIIDPWTAIPVFQFSLSDRAYDVDWDNAGNCYAYGGSGQYSEFPLYMLKYDSNGNLLWETQIDEGYRYDFGTELYGDFVVDKNSQSVYIAMGVNTFYGAKILKLNQAGSLIDSSAGNLNMNAMWRIAYSSKYNELVGVGGNYPNYPSATAMYIDTNLTTEQVVYVNNPPNPYRYMWGVTLDNSGNCYMALSGSTMIGDTAGNDLFKVPMPTLSPTTWEVNDGYEIVGIGDPQYIAHNNGNGFNGMTVSDTNLYTYDSYTLKKWSTNSGALLNTLNINGDSTKWIYWEGITSDSCGNVFLGSHDTVKQYNSNLSLLSYFLAPDSIYDLNLGNNKILYACGADFISAYLLAPHLVNTNTNTDADTTLYYTICLGNSAPLKAGGAMSYAWAPSYGLSATTGDSVSATPSVTTTYTVICSGSLTCPASTNDTFKIVVTVDTFPLPHITVSPTSSTICYGKSVHLNGSGVKTYQWTPSTGLNSSTGDEVIASPTTSTSYTVKGIDSNGCYDIGYSTVTVDTLPQVNISESDFIICKGQPDTLSANQEFSYQWSPPGGLNSTTSDTVIATPSVSTVYIVTLTGNNGCTNTAGIEVYVRLVDVVVTPPSPSVCPGHSISLTIAGASTYQWSPSAGIDSIATDSVIASPTASTTYTIIGNTRGCSDTVQSVITVSFPHVVITPSSPSVCPGDSITLYASGADTFQWSPSVGLNTIVGDTIIANPTIATTYSIIGSNGCKDTATTIITVNPLPNVGITQSTSICLPQSISLTASGAVTYQWSPSGSLNINTGDSVVATPTTTTTYTVSGIDSLGCEGISLDTISIRQPPNRPLINRKGNNLISTATQSNQWVRNDTVIDGATNETYSVTTIGCYWVVATNLANGCSSISDTVCIDSIAGINQLSVNSNQLSVYPNPTGGELFININSSVADIKDWNLLIADVLGRTLFTKQSLNYINDIDLSNLPGGMYFITIVNKTGRVVVPVVRQ